MKIDLGKELASANQLTRRQDQLLHAAVLLAGLSVLLLVLVLVVRPRAAAAPTERIVLVADTQLVARLEARLATFESMLQDLRVVLLQSKFAVKDLTATQKVAKRRDRSIAQNTTAATARRAMRWLPGMQATNIALSADELSALDALIDRDQSGEQVRALLQSITEPQRRTAYQKQLQRKGDQWLSAALPLIESDDPGYELYCDNALYFYDIISATCEDTALLAYVETKRSQIELALQRLDSRMRSAESEGRLRDELQTMQERMDAWRTNRSRRMRNY
jgi:hypothetical protein